jgi:hypothetical protein
VREAAPSGEVEAEVSGVGSGRIEVNLHRVEMR